MKSLSNAVVLTMLLIGWLLTAVVIGRILLLWMRQ